jgi:hypothetical protein
MRYAKNKFLSPHNSFVEWQLLEKIKVSGAGSSKRLSSGYGNVFQTAPLSVFHSSYLAACGCGPEILLSPFSHKYSITRLGDAYTIRARHFLLWSRVRHHAVSNPPGKEKRRS